MIDLKSVREDPAPARAGLARRGRAEDLDRLLAIDEEWRGLTAEVEALRAEQNRVSKEVGRAEATERERLIASVRDLTDRLSVLEARLADVAARRDRLLLEVPNPPHPSVPDGESDEDNEVVRVVGQVPERPWAADHVDLGTALGVLDLDRAVRLSGSRFAYLTGPGVWLEFALVRYALDLVAAKGFVPVVPPVLVREEAMYGTGFLPADEAQIYVTREDGLYLVGTSEVALAGLHQEEILEADALPRRYAGFSTCFRREAGSYGRDTRGMFRVHQFDKVEMFSFTLPEASWDEHEFLLACQEEIVGGLGLPYRVVNVCVGELGASAAKKYDIEVWLPGQGTYRELTSCSSCTDYQARRLQARYRAEGENRPMHTLNGTACAVGRTIIAVLENGQREDGSVALPEALHPYLPPGMEILTPVQP